ncbi:MAG TPA: HAD hydrolase-like protein, partial [Accumulibacter sp.]|nr:HAD hydrolase-like protein [Accumulibacter sp.]
MSLPIQAIIFDLDHCLLDPRVLGDAFVEPVCSALRATNAGTLSERQLLAACADLWRHPFDAVADEYGFSVAMRVAGCRAYAALEVSFALRGYADLAALGQLPAMKFLVTTGYRRLQQSKIAALGFGEIFEEIHIDALEEPGRLGKEGLFAQIVQRRRFTPRQVLIVGDNGASEIAAGNRLRMPTVQLLRPGVARAPNADFHV